MSSPNGVLLREVSLYPGHILEYQQQQQQQQHSYKNFLRVTLYKAVTAVHSQLHGYNAL